jgi:hypothetical protein
VETINEKTPPDLPGAQRSGHLPAELRDGPGERPDRPEASAYGSLRSPKIDRTPSVEPEFCLVAKKGSPLAKRLIEGLAAVRQAILPERVGRIFLSRVFSVLVNIRESSSFCHGLIAILKSSKCWYHSLA